MEHCGRVSEDEWRKIGEEKLKLVDRLSREIIYGTGEGDLLLQVRREQGKIIVKPTPWFM